MDALASLTRTSVRAASGYERVVAFIKEQLVSGALKEGDMLLPERELAAALNVSRPMVREALRSLSIIGAVEIIHGVGTMVRRPDAETLGEFFSVGLAQHAHVVEDVMEARVAIECQSVRLACRLATAADFDSLLVGIDTIGATVGDPQAGARADFDFHHFLVRASRSPTLISIYSVISGLLLRSHLNRRLDLAGGNSADADLVKAHLAIVDAVKDGDPDIADRVLRDHFAIGAEKRPHLDLGSR